ncbi:MAG: Asp-tRNA(Asn)/Glu-tRNA(Gln) amidotransferase subunit GatA [Candidatus Aenigmarchaeota archaeon]|nr:Asp-tRNA(Asn)/Glu-tRNA(Gln) amidotransferase subunit GatA [Candidatus Aenigmarchaeota archaeon]
MTRTKLSAVGFIDAVKRGQVNLDEFYVNLFTELARLNEKHNFMITIAEGKPSSRGGRLAGLPVSVKDCICTKGIQSTAGSRILEGYVPPFDATCVERVKQAGAEVVGKTAQDEFGFGTFSTNCAFGVPTNPIDPSRSCGGSSGGAAGLVRAMDMPHVAIGQSTGGSISCPAAFCGVVGLTPTYGLVSRYGLIDYANSLDKIGPIAKTVEDVALMLSVIAGRDARDQTTIDKKPQDYLGALGKGKDDLKGMRIGIPKEYMGGGVDDGVRRKVLDAVGKMEELGARSAECTLLNTRYSIPAYYIIATAEASTNLAKFCGMRYGAEGKVEGEFNEYFSKVRSKHFGDEAKRRILLGTFARMAGYRDQYYLKAMKVRTLIINDFKRAFRRFDVLAAPTMPFIAPKFSEISKMSPIQNYMSDILTVAPNMAGIPMLSVPCGEIRGMPVGMHILGNHLEEGKILRVGKAFESLSG